MLITKRRKGARKDRRTLYILSNLFQILFFVLFGPLLSCFVLFYSTLFCFRCKLFCPCVFFFVPFCSFGSILFGFASFQIVILSHAKKKLKRNKRYTLLCTKAREILTHQIVVFNRNFALRI